MAGADLADAKKRKQRKKRRQRKKRCGMKFFREDIWQDGEYTYEAAYGFVPNLHFYLHEDDGSERSETTGAAYSDSQCSDSSAAAPNQTETAGASRPFMRVVPGGGYCMVVPPEERALMIARVQSISSRGAEAARRFRPTNCPVPDTQVTAKSAAIHVGIPRSDAIMPKAKLTEK